MTDLKPRFFRLEGQEVVPCADVLEWGRWLEENDKTRQVALDRLDGDICVSTVFIGIGGPMRIMNQMFETRIFRGGHDGHQERTETWDEAISAHARALAKAMR